MDAKEVTKMAAYTTPPFTGTMEERSANMATHYFCAAYEGEEFMDTRCMHCDAKPWHRAAAYPCGEAPQVEIFI